MYTALSGVRNPKQTSITSRHRQHHLGPGWYKRWAMPLAEHDLAVDIMDVDIDYTPLGLDLDV